MLALFLAAVIGGGLVYGAFLCQEYYRFHARVAIQRSWDLTPGKAGILLEAHKLAIDGLIREVKCAIEEGRDDALPALVARIKQLEGNRKMLFVAKGIVQNNPWFRAGYDYKPVHDVARVIRETSKNPERVLESYRVFPGEAGITVSGKVNENTEIRFDNIVSMADGWITGPDGNKYRLGTPAKKEPYRKGAAK